MTGFLVDTNVLSDIRKGDRADAGVQSWFRDHGQSQMFLSVIVVGELRRGAALLRRRDPGSADRLDAWIDGLLANFSARLLNVDAAIAVRWGLLGVPDPVPVADGLIAATALEHDLVVVTRNVADIERTGAEWVNPFEEPTETAHST